MTTSESPTHPDAPRAGGETPDIDLEATLRVLRIVEYDLRHRDEAPEPNATSNEIHAEFAETLAALRTALPALLERHRDGERLDWLEHCNSQKRGDVPILPPSCGYSVRQYIDRQLADANTPCAAPPSPERASK